MKSFLELDEGLQIITNSYGGSVVKKKKLTSLPELSYGPNFNGLFADKDFNAGEWIESVPYIEIPKFSFEKFPLDKVFKLLEDVYVIPLGWASLIRYSKDPNVDWEWDYDDELIHIYALKNVQRGDELFISFLRKIKLKKD
jgi:hypothetical protein